MYHSVHLKFVLCHRCPEVSILFMNFGQYEVMLVMALGAMFF
ncbi:hypothetical protein DSUL_50428 [Desulfovibrionales bacterium]